MGGNNDFFLNFERNKYLKKLPSMQKVNQSAVVFWALNNFHSSISISADPDQSAPIGAP